MRWPNTTDLYWLYHLCQPLVVAKVNVMETMGSAAGSGGRLAVMGCGT